jgi:hypothetical protein
MIDIASSSLSPTRGIINAVKSTAVGLLDSPSKFTDTIGKGVTILSFDETFQRDHTRDMAKKPKV